MSIFISLYDGRIQEVAKSGTAGEACKVLGGLARHSPDDLREVTMGCNESIPEPRPANGILSSDAAAINQSGIRPEVTQLC